MHHHYALQVGLSLTGPLQIRTTPHAPLSTAAGSIIAPNTPHQIVSAHTQALFLWTEHLYGSSGGRLDDGGTGITLLTQAQLEPLMALLTPAVTHPLTCTTAALLMRSLLDRLGLSNRLRPPLDPRIAASVQRLRRGDSSWMERPIHDLAAAAHLSASRFRHLFKQHMGMSVQRYILWQRLLRAMRASIEEPSLTGAAHTAGFADSAHFARVFRATFGLAPSRVLKDSHAVQVIPCLED